MNTKEHLVILKCTCKMTITLHLKRLDSSIKDRRLCIMRLKTRKNY